MPKQKKPKKIVVLIHMILKHSITITLKKKYKSHQQPVLVLILLLNYTINDVKDNLK